MERSSIMPLQTGGSIQYFDLYSEGTLEAVKGGCYLSVGKGSIVFEQHKSEPLNISGQMTPLDLGHIFSSAGIYFVQNTFFKLTAGESGCRVTLYYPPIEKKDWGINGIEKQH